MKQTSFDTKRQAEEMLRQAIQIWQQTEHSEYLEGLDKDPVFVLLMNALAYQSNEIDSEIEKIKTDVIEEFEHLLSLDNTGNPIPASVAVQMSPYDVLDSKVIDSRTTFSINDKKNTFSLIPLLHTLVVNTQVDNIYRLNERQWEVTFEVAQTLHDLRGWSFAIHGIDFHELKVSLKGTDGNLRPLDLIGPEDFSELPMTKEFSAETLLYNRTHSQTAGGGRHGALSSYMNWCAMDLFVRQNTRMFFVDWDDSKAQIKKEVDRFSLIFEFSGFNHQGMAFTKDNLFINTNILINAECHSAHLSGSTPIVRLTGGQQMAGAYFLHLLRPEEEQIFGSLPLQVRRVMSDRFNHTKLQKLIYNLVTKYHTDFYAFLSLGMKSAESNIQRLRNELTDMQKNMEMSDVPIQEGVYLMIDSMYNSQITEAVSLRVDYLVTNGASANDAMSDGELSTCEGITSVTRIAPGVSGADAIRSGDAERVASKYLLVTGDRLVTPFDVKMFVQMELLTRYDIVKDMISNIKIGRQHLDQGSYHTFLTTVDINLTDNKFIKRTFMDKLPTVEVYLKKMIQVRSSNAFPVSVHITVGKS